MRSLAILKNQLEKLKVQQQNEFIQHLKIDGFCLQVNHPQAIEYNPYFNSQVHTFENFHNDSSMFRVLMGAFGSGKSTSCCADIVLRACKMIPMRDGVRRSRFALIRNTMGMLESTTLMTWRTWFRHLGEVIRTKKPILTFTHKFNDDFGRVELELFFLGLDRDEDKQKLESLELTGAYINELQHVPRGIVAHLIGRTGRYPRIADIRCEVPKMIIADTNPPDEDHWIYTDFEINPIEGNRLFKQPPGLIKNQQNEWMENVKRDNNKFLSSTYYLDMARANHFREEFIKVYCRGEYGIVIPGKKVFPEYNDDLHSVDDLSLLPNCPIIIGADGGMTPCVLCMQVSDNNQLRIFKEFVTERSSVQSLFKNWVIPYIENNLKGYEVLIITDPTMCDPHENTGTSSAEIIAELGYEALPAKTNKIDRRLEAVKSFLNTLIKGEPAFLLSRTECPTLRKSFAGKYCYKRVRIIGDEKYKDLPEKSHPWSDIIDCCQYGCLEVKGEGIRFQEKPDKKYNFINREKF